MAHRLGPRERLISAATELTYRHGVEVGTDAILKKADVARASLYQHFQGKDGLVTAVLERSTRDDLERYRNILTGAGDDPRERILAVFDWLDTVVTRPSFRGCRYIAAETGLPNARHPAHQIIHDYAAQLRELFATELRALNHPTPDTGALQIVTLIHGILSTSLLDNSTDVVAAARSLAEAVLSQGV